VFTQFEDWEIVKDGMTTPEAAEYLNSCNLGRTYDANSVKDMCRDGRIPSAKIRDRHKVHKTNLDELVAEARRIIPTPPQVEDKPEQKNIDQLLAARQEWEKSMERRFDILERAVAELKRQMVEEFSRANEREERRFADTNARVDEVSKKQTITSSWLRENFSSEWKESDS
jgi:ribosome-interacting GTPase 1